MTILAALALVLPLQITPMWDSLNMRSVGAWPYGSLGWHQVVDDSFLYVLSGSGLVVFNISDPASPTKLDSFQFGASFHARVGNTLYGIGANRGVVLVDVTRPESPSLVGYHLTPDFTVSLCAQDSLLYVAASGAGLRIIDVTDPEQPEEVGAWASSTGRTLQVAVRGNHAFLADGYDGFRVIDISDLRNPEEAFWHRIEREFARSIALTDTLALVAWGRAGLRIWSISDPTRPVELGVLDYGYVRNVVVKDSFAFVIARTGRTDTMLIVSIADPARPRPVAGHPGGFFLKLWNDLCFVSNPDNPHTEDSLYILDVINPLEPVLLGTCTGFHEDFDVLRVTGGLGFGGTRGRGLRVFDVSSPAEPRLIGQLGDWHIQKLAPVGNLVHLACTYGPPPYRVVDVSDPRNPVQVGMLDSAYSGAAVSARDTLVFLAVFNQVQSWYLWILNAADPTRPRVLSRIRSGPDRQIRSSVADGNLLYIAENLDGLRIFDITDPTRPEFMGQCYTPGTPQDVKVRYPYAYIADGTSGITIVDVSDPGNPFVVGNHPTHYGTFNIDLDGNTAYVADGWWGVRAFDVTHPVEPKPAGFYITPCFAYDVQTRDGLVYVADGRGWLVLERCPPGVEEQGRSHNRGSPYILPNPARDRVRLPGTTGAGLYAADGRRVAVLQPGENDIRHLAPGVYFVRTKGSRIQGSEGSSVKVVIQR